MEAKPKTTMLTVDPKKFLLQFPETSPSLRSIAEECEKNGQDVRVEFLIVNMNETHYVPLSAMPAVKEARHA